jgi:hypothetical protein
VQLTESLVAHVNVKRTGQPVEYNALSSGIRSYLFGMGYLMALYFEREVDRGFLLLDEPENSLYPDLLYGLMDEYRGIVKNTQIFVATHSPIIAAQFQPSARLRLDFDDDAFVVAERGHSPMGDDANDLLKKDFQVESVYGPEGQKQWERFLEIRQQLRLETDEEKRRALVREYSTIGNAYGFEPGGNEIPAQE